MVARTAFALCSPSSRYTKFVAQKAAPAHRFMYTRTGFEIKLKERVQSEKRVGLFEKLVHGGPGGDIE